MVRALLLAWVGFGFLLWAGQEVLIYPGMWMHGGTDVRQAGWGELIEAPRSDGSTVPVLLADAGHRRLVLLFHGNGETAAMMKAYAEALDELGWAFAAMEYRGYAGTEGWPTERRLAADVAATIRALGTRGFPPNRTVVHGRSIGGGVAATYLDHARPAGMVLESSFDSLEAVVRERWIGLVYPISWLLRQRYRTDVRLARTSVPVLRVHDEHDAVVALERVRQLDAMAPGEVVLTSGHPHGTPLVLRDPAARDQWVRWLGLRLSSSVDGPRFPGGRPTGVRGVRSSAGGNR